MLQTPQSIKLQCTRWDSLVINHYEKQLGLMQGIQGVISQFKFKFPFTFHLCCTSKEFWHFLLVSDKFRFKWHQARLTWVRCQTHWDAVTTIRTLSKFRIVSPEYWVLKPWIAFGIGVTVQDVVAKKCKIQVRKGIFPLRSISLENRCPKWHLKISSNGLWCS